MFYRLRLYSWVPHSPSWRAFSSNTSSITVKYEEKLRQLAQQKGLSVNDLRDRAREERESKRKESRETETARVMAPKESTTQSTSNASQSRPLSPPGNLVRKDSSPVKPLSSILNLPRILLSPHTPAQISALWTAYHTSLSGGTGRGYVCASVPLDVYKRMAEVAVKYPSFVVPLPRATLSEIPVNQGNKAAYEFYFLEWAFHEAPPVPSATEPNLFATPKSNEASTGGSPNPRISTILFTSLQEYKSRGSFATPYLVTTHYTDLASTHGIVLLRGEITLSAASTTATSNANDGRYLMQQEDAQILSMAVQKFYLWGSKNGEESEGGRLLRLFHEKPEEFKWEELLKHSDWTM